MTIQVQDIKNYSVEDIREILAYAAISGEIAAKAFVDKWTAETGGNQYGEPMYCGTASTRITGVKGNTRVGKALKAAGLTQDYTRSFYVSNSSGHHGQSLDVKEAGSAAHAQVLRDYGFDAYVNSRAD